MLLVSTIVILLICVRGSNEPRRDWMHCRPVGGCPHDRSLRHRRIGRDRGADRMEAHPPRAADPASRCAVRRRNCRARRPRRPVHRKEPLMRKPLLALPLLASLAARTEPGTTPDAPDNPALLPGLSTGLLSP